MTKRDLENREATKRVATYKPASLLPDPDPQAGIEFRYVRIRGSDGSLDMQNFSKRKREGWEPVKASDHPELQIESDTNARFPDSVEISGMVLCKNSVENVEARNEYFAQQAENQIQSVDQAVLRENDPRMPISKPERKSRTTFGRQ